MAKATRIGNTVVEWTPAFNVQLSHEEGQFLRDLLGGSVVPPELTSLYCTLTDDVGLTIGSCDYEIVESN